MSPWPYPALVPAAGDPWVQWARGIPANGGAEGEEGADLTDPQWRALIYVAGQHGFSVPRLGLEGKDETLDVDGSDVERLRGALGKALVADDTEEMRTPDGELDYDTIQLVRHVLLSEGVRLARPRAGAGE